MASAIDPSVIVDNEKVDKADLREQFTIAGNEITALQEDVADLTTDLATTNTNVTTITARLSLARQMMYSNALFSSL